jgi:Protein of unknown function (DUF732)
MRDRETIDSELRLIAQRRRSIREQGGQLSSRQLDELLDERLGHRAEASETEAVATDGGQVVTATWPHRDERDDIRPYRRRSALRRFGPLAVLPLSLIAAAAVLVMMFAAHKPPPAEPAADPAPPSSARPAPAAPQAPAPPLDNIADRAFVDVLKQEGVPVPSREYVTTHGHAVCDFLTQQPNFADAVRYVQRSSVWDADQSANFTAGAVVSYCPQYEPASSAELQPGFQNALSDMQRIQGDLQRIQGDLQGIRNGLPAIPGHQ